MIYVVYVNYNWSCGECIRRCGAYGFQTIPSYIGHLHTWSVDNGVVRDIFELGHKAPYRLLAGSATQLSQAAAVPRRGETMKPTLTLEMYVQVWISPVNHGPLKQKNLREEQDARKHERGSERVDSSL